MPSVPRTWPHPTPPPSMQATRSNRSDQFLPKRRSSGPVSLGLEWKRAGARWRLVKRPCRQRRGQKLELYGCAPMGAAWQISDEEKPRAAG